MTTHDEPHARGGREALHQASCHCGSVRVEIFAPLPERVYDCNCSICSQKGYLHWFVPRADVRIEAGEGVLATYTFNTGRAKHHFCTQCGVAPFYVARSHPDSIDVNVRCVEDVDLGALEIVPFDGRNWEQAVARLRDES